MLPKSDTRICQLTDEMRQGAGSRAMTGLTTEQLAVKWYRKAAALGNEEARSVLCRLGVSE